MANVIVLSRYHDLIHTLLQYPEFLDISKEKTSFSLLIKKKKNMLLTSLFLFNLKYLEIFTQQIS